MAIEYLVITILFIVTTAIIDCEHIIKGEYISDHGSRFVQRLVFFMALIISNLYYGIAAALLFSSIFDQLLNLFRNKDFCYLGSVSKWDLFWTKYKKLYVVIKILMFASSIYLFIKF